MKNIKNSGMVRVIAWTKEKGEFYDYVKWSRLKELIDKGYVVALAD